MLDFDKIEKMENSLEQMLRKSEDLKQKSEELFDRYTQPGTDENAFATITPELEHRKPGYVERKRRPYQGNVARIA